MSEKNIRVLALDLDGTLTNDEKKVTPRTRAALDAAVAKGVTIVLASAGKGSGAGQKGRLHPGLQWRCHHRLQNGGDPLPEAAGPGHGA